MASVPPNWDTGGPKKQDTGPKNRFTGGSKTGPPETARGELKRAAVALGFIGDAGENMCMKLAWTLGYLGDSVKGTQGISGVTKPASVTTWLEGVVNR